MSQLEDRGQRWHWRRMEQARAEGYKRRLAVEEQERRDAEKLRRQAEEKAILALDYVLECAALLNAECAALMVAASASDIAGVEARLWTSRRIVSSACKSWREFVPAQESDETEGGDADV